MLFRPAADRPMQKSKKVPDNDTIDRPDVKGAEKEYSVWKGGAVVTQPVQLTATACLHVNVMHAKEKDVLIATPEKDTTALWYLYSRQVTTITEGLGKHEFTAGDCMCVYHPAGSANYIHIDSGITVFIGISCTPLFYLLLPGNCRNSCYGLPGR